MRPGALAWTVLPAVGGPPAGVVPGEEHLARRAGPTMVAVDDRVLVWGGYDSYGDPLGSALGLTLDADGRVQRRWDLDWCPGDRATVVDGLVVVVGPDPGSAQRALVFHPDRPEGAEQFPAPISGRSAPATRCGTVVVTWGGDSRIDIRDRDDANVARGDGAAFEVDSRRWSMLPEAPIAARAGHVLQAVGDDVVVWGGWRWGGRDAGVLGDGAVYNVAGREWRPMRPAPLSPRRDPSSAVLGGRVFVWSGFGDASNAYLGDGGRYDPVDDTWTPLPPSPVRMPGAVAFAVDDTVLLCGGTHAGGRDVRLLAYHEPTDSWVVPDLEGFVPGPAALARLANGDVYVWSFVDPHTEHALLRER